MRKKLTWRDVEIKRNFSFAQAYEEKLSGLSWTKVSKGWIDCNSLKRLLKEWCIDNGKDYTELSATANGYGEPTNDSDKVDRGRVMALYRAGWDIHNISIDCYCTEACAADVIAQEGNR